ncbi:hypothetical protein [Frankia sp. Cas3]|uniref:hypothetical protein n=1 Tax=Frankia sp. Cas3 TaxID=3073926 RepID=UPI002AD3E51E|nr:hypothetical protein [Frankia sp. Cas3]
MLPIITELRSRATEAAYRLTLAAATAVLAHLDPTPPVRPLPRRDTPTVPAAVDVPRLVADPATVFSADELDAIDPETIAHAADEFDQAGDQARAADRTKRRARKFLDRLPAGVYGAWLVERVESPRLVADLELIRATYAAAGLGDVPMRPCAPSLRVQRVEVPVLAVAA